MKKFMVTGKKVALATILSVLTITTTALAGTISSSTYSNKKTTSNYKGLGSGTHYLNARSIRGSGTARAKKIVRFAPDTTVATVKLKKDGDCGCSSFNAQRYTDKREVQSYYINYSKLI